MAISSWIHIFTQKKKRDHRNIARHSFVVMTWWRHYSWLWIRNEEASRGIIVIKIKDTTANVKSSKQTLNTNSMLCIVFMCSCWVHRSATQMSWSTQSSYTSAFFAPPPRSLNRWRNLCTESKAFRYFFSVAIWPSLSFCLQTQQKRNNCDGKLVSHRFPVQCNSTQQPMYFIRSLTERLLSVVGDNVGTIATTTTAVAIRHRLPCIFLPHLLLFSGWASNYTFVSSLPFPFRSGGEYVVLLFYFHFFCISFALGRLLVPMQFLLWFSFRE